MPILNRQLETHISNISIWKSISPGSEHRYIYRARCEFKKIATGKLLLNGSHSPVVRPRLKHISDDAAGVRRAILQYANALS